MTLSKLSNFPENSVSFYKKWEKIWCWRWWWWWCLRLTFIKHLLWTRHCYFICFSSFTSYNSCVRCKHSSYPMYVHVLLHIHKHTQRNSFNLSITWWFYHFWLYLPLPWNHNHRFWLDFAFLLLKEACSLWKLISPIIFVFYIIWFFSATGSKWFFLHSFFLMCFYWFFR